MEFLSLLWTTLSFVFSLVWQLVWFLLRDLVSTFLWIVVAAWLILSVRYRSFYSGSLALLRFGRYGLRLFWQWLRGTSSAPPPLTGDLKYAGGRSRKPIGTMHISTQLNMLLVGGLCLLLLG